MKQLASFLIACACSITAFAQISEGGTPPSFKYETRLKSAPFDSHTLAVPVNLNMDELRKEDRLAKEIAAPLRIAVSIPVAVDIQTTGEWSALPGGEKIWQQSVFMPDALGMIISYNDFYIPEGGKLYIYNDDRTQILGAYTHHTNPAGGAFSTEMIRGHKFTFEYVASQSTDEQPRIAVKDIGYVYGERPKNDVKKYPTSPTLNGSDNCMINVNCSEGDDWQIQKRGVVHLAMKFSDGWYVCSGSLVNNANNDGKPYVLTGNHCFYKNDSPVDVADFVTSQYYFNYEYPTCSNKITSPISVGSIIGSTQKARLPLGNRSDGLLLELSTPVPAEWNPYYNGWDASNSAVASGVVIHHPAGDVKKISTFTQQLTSAEWGQSSSNPNSKFWKVRYADTENGHAVTEGGSSGSPIFNQNGLIVGTLTGGSTYCTETYDKDTGEYLGGPNDSDLFGKMWYHFNQSPTANQKMKAFLAPNADITSLQGYDPNGGNAIHVERETIQIALFPNPATDVLNINAKGIIESIQIVDAWGHTAYEAGELQSSTTSIAVSAWASGIYFVTVKTGNGIYTGKVMKNQQISKLVN